MIKKATASYQLKILSFLKNNKKILDIYPKYIFYVARPDDVFCFSLILDFRQGNVFLVKVKILVKYIHYEPNI